MRAIEDCVKDATFKVYKRAARHCEIKIQDASKVISNYFYSIGFSLDNFCFAVVGSVGRTEALEASDFDIVPIASSQELLSFYVPHDKKVRELLRSTLDSKVSEGRDLTAPTSLELLIETDSIGGAKDTSNTLTRRILILTESRQICGGLSIRFVRENILNAYSTRERTSGRHVLTLCNDVARYHKTLCVEYKAKIDEQDKDWSTRNIKLRHSRKLWFFSVITSFAMLADAHPKGSEKFQNAILDVLEKSPTERLASALIEKQPLATARLLEHYALFLEFMSNKENREALSVVGHSARYNMELKNPFPTMKFNSDLLHYEILAIIEELGPSTRSRIMSWFML